MAVLLSELIKETRNMDIVLLAGKEGLNKNVTWAHMVETEEASTFLFGKEIVFTTGLGLNENFHLIDLIKCIHKKESVGIVVNTGPFVDHVDDECLRYCDEHSLPLFTVPWRIQLAQIMKKFCFYITKSDQKDFEIAGAFKNALHFPEQQELYVVPLSNRGFSSNVCYAVTVLGYEIHDTDTPDYHSFVTRMRAYLQYKYPQTAVFDNEGEIVLVTAGITEEELREITENLRHKTREILGKLPFDMGVGRLTRSIRCLYKSYNQARAIIRLSKKNVLKGKYFYSDLGLYRLLIGIEDRDVINDYLDKTIMPILRYDKETGSNLTETLSCYLKNNGSVKDTSEELFVHRNTTNYKINKIEDLIGEDLSLLENRTQFILAFALYDMFGGE